MKAGMGPISRKEQIVHCASILVYLQTIKKTAAAGKTSETLKLIDEVTEEESRRLDKIMGFERETINE